MTQSLLPLRPGKVARHTHDYKRNGTSTLFAALNVATREMIGECQPRHRRQEPLRFLGKLGKELQPIVDNYSTHKGGKVRKWLNKHRRFHLHSSFHPYRSLLDEYGRDVV